MIREYRFHLMLALALTVAGLAATGVFQYLKHAERNSRIVTRPVVVATVDLVEGHVITAPQVRVVQLPLAAVPRDAFVVPDSVIGRVARVPVFIGEALLPGRLAPVGASGGLEVKITPGRRAMAVKIDEVAGVSGLIQPNSRVDVLVTLKSIGTNEIQQARLFMSNMRVLSVGSELERGPDGRPVSATTAALEVTPSEAEQLAVASNAGKIQLVLRGFGDPDTVDTRGATSRDILQRLDFSSGTEVTASTAPPVRPAKRVTPRPTPRPVPPPVASVPLVNTASLTMPPAKVPRTDSTVVQVYRRDKVSLQKIEKRDTARRISPDDRPFEPLLPE